MSLCPFWRFFSKITAAHNKLRSIAFGAFLNFFFCTWILSLRIRTDKTVVVTPISLLKSLKWKKKRENNFLGSLLNSPVGCPSEERGSNFKWCRPGCFQVSPLKIFQGSTRNLKCLNKDLWGSYWGSKSRSSNFFKNFPRIFKTLSKISLQRSLRIFTNEVSFRRN